MHILLFRLVRERNCYGWKAIFTPETALEEYSDLSTGQLMNADHIRNMIVKINYMAPLKIIVEHHKVTMIMIIDVLA